MELKKGVRRDPRNSKKKGASETDIPKIATNWGFAYWNPSILCLMAQLRRQEIARADPHGLTRFKEPWNAATSLVPPWVLGRPCGTLVTSGLAGCTDLHPHSSAC